MFEYFVFHTSKIPIFNDGSQIQDELNRLGSLGWKLITVEWRNPWTINILFFSFTWVQKQHVFYFIREKKE